MTDERKTLMRLFVDGLVAEAEARGYRKGVEDAETVYKTRGADNMEWDYFSCASHAILALLEQTSDTNSPHPLSGAGNVAKE